MEKLKLKQLVEKEYGICINKLTRLTKLAHHTVYLAETSDGSKFIIKLLPIENNMCKNGIFLQEKLARKKIAPKIIKSNNGEDYILCSNEILFMQENIETSNKIECNIQDLITMYKELGKNYIHGDLRPSNVLYTKNHHSCFIDFEYSGPGNRSAEILKFLILESKGNIRYIYKKYNEIGKVITLDKLEKASMSVLKSGYDFNFVLNHLNELSTNYLKNEIEEHGLVIKTCLEKINVKRQKFK